ncbi:hypothetical protein BXY51_009122 [Actinoplanes cyaneus]|nr:hypothetical protein [Actinoplanes cyaneus]
MKSAFLARVVWCCSPKPVIGGEAEGVVTGSAERCRTAFNDVG